MAALNATAVTSNTSADFTLAAATSTTLSLSGTGPLGLMCQAQVQIKSAAATYQTIAQLDSRNPMLVLAAIGTFRVVKGDNAAQAFGVERD